MARIVGIAGSLRAGSYNASLLRAATGLMPAGSTLEVGTIRGIPLYDGDVEAAEGVPPAVVTLRDQIATADGVLIVSPEYNNSMPGVLKNAIDWLSRQSANGDHTFGNRAFAVIGASPGGFGTILAQNAWLPVLRTLGTRQWFGGRLMVSRAGSVFNEAGELVDEKIAAQLAKFLDGFVAFTKS
ncbi:NADPH-dependent FMN reductase [Uliginosibacterium sp. H3]|uniref:NADPH-dependent FMN reductase n=1 Tax=Uliginosibacterium silvisoli TaxID=3114758 RepID=A0ABU6K0I5_9RHOO|nr:NADPH-dependent FMN reductase [Uliginosibacterium sp. H3]